VKERAGFYVLGITKVTDQVEVDKRHGSNFSHKPQSDICESKQTNQYEQGAYDSPQYLAWRHMSQLCVHPIITPDVVPRTPIEISSAIGKVTLPWLSQ